VIVEVKGCWHSELQTAMLTQLRDRYLKGKPTRTGLYIVGGMEPGLGRNDPRKRSCGKIGFEKLRVELEGKRRRYPSPFS